MVHYMSPTTTHRMTSVISFRNIFLFVLCIIHTDIAFAQQPQKKYDPPATTIEGPIRNPTPAIPEQAAPTPQGMAPPRVDDTTLYSKSCPELKKALVPLIRKVNEMKRREKGLFSEFTEKEREELAKSSQTLEDIKIQLRQRCQEPPKQDPKKKQRRPPQM